MIMQEVFYHSDRIYQSEYYKSIVRTEIRLG
jgi:hypothetical protein